VNTQQKSQVLTIIRSLIVLGMIAIAVLAIFPSISDQIIPTETISIECAIGSEKSGFLSNEQVQDILARRYGLDVSFRRVGSIEQAYMDTTGLDCLWPSNTSAAEIFGEQNPTANMTQEIIFNSPIVLYSWATIVDALETEGLVTQTSEGIYTADTFQLFDELTGETRQSWADLGVDQLFGNFNIITTDPTRSNSGNMFYALMANALADGNVATLEVMEPLLPTIKEFYDGQGRLEESSGILFEQYIITGIGAHPIIANYESLIIEFAIANREQLDAITEQLRIIYLTPTVWSSHPLIGLTDGGDQLIEALKDPELQQIAWEQHGFRSGLASIQNDVAVFGINGIKPTVTSVIPLPRADALISMLEFLGWQAQ